MTREATIAELASEHQALLAEVRDLSAVVHAFRAGQGLEWYEVCGALRGRLESFHQGLVRHFRREEEELFPLAKGAADHDGAANMVVAFLGKEAEEDLGAHGVMTTRAEQLLSLLSDGSRVGADDDPRVGRARALISFTRSLLERHIAKEDQLIFPAVLGLSR